MPGLFCRTVTDVGGELPAEGTPPSPTLGVNPMKFIKSALIVASMTTFAVGVTACDDKKDDAKKEEKKDEKKEGEKADEKK
jgi:hypothetical protein